MCLEAREQALAGSHANSDLVHGAYVAAKLRRVPATHSHVNAGPVARIGGADNSGVAPRSGVGYGTHRLATAVTSGTWPADRQYCDSVRRTAK